MALTNILAPAGILVAYLYWFAYVRASAYYGFFGVSGAIGLQFDSKENAADSINALVSPVAVVAALTLVAAGLHRSITGALERRKKKMPEQAPWPRVAGILPGSLAVLLFLPLLLEWLPTVLLPGWSGGPDWPEYLAGAVGVALLNYASHLRNRYGKPARNARDSAQLKRWASAALALALLVAASASFASNLGFEQALRVTQSGGLRSVTIYSKESQSLSMPGITTTKLPVSDGYRYRYTGLLLLAVQGHEFIVIPAAERYGPPTAILITDEDGIRVEISLT